MSDASPVLLTPDVVGGLAGKRVLVVGDIMLDAYLIGDADRISPEAPVPVVRIEKERYLLGGAGNVARNIVALGGVATLAGVMARMPPPIVSGGSSVMKAFAARSWHCRSARPR